MKDREHLGTTNFIHVERLQEANNLAVTRNLQKVPYIYGTPKPNSGSIKR